MRKYNRVMAGRGGMYANDCVAGGYIGVGFLRDHDLTGQLPDAWREFNAAFTPVYRAENAGKSKVAAGLACGAVWTVCKGLQTGDIVITPNGEGRYHAGEIRGDYQYEPDQPLAHQRPVHWYGELFDRSDMSEALQRSTGSIGTVCDITKHASELDQFIHGDPAPTMVSSDPEVENVSAFALEKHLQDFLVSNWSSTALGKTHDIYTDDGEIVGKEYPTDTGAIDILAISKDGKELLVVELKKGRASDVVVGQIQRYMGFVMDELCEPGQAVAGVIIALDDDLRIRRALRVTERIKFCRYRVSFSIENWD